MRARSALCLISLCAVEINALSQTRAAVLSKPRAAVRLSDVAAPAPTVGVVTSTQSAAPKTAAPSGGGTATAARIAFLHGCLDVATFNGHNMFCNKMTGHTYNLFFALSTLSLADAAFAFAVLLSYVSGVGALRRLGSLRGSKPLSTVAAPTALALLLLADVMLAHTGGSRWAMALVAAASGVVSSACIAMTGSITAMVTGHMQVVSNALADALGGGSAPAMTKPMRTSLIVIGSFGAGVASSAVLAARRLLPPIIALPTFSVIGVAYALALVLHDRPLRRRASAA